MNALTNMNVALSCQVRVWAVRRLMVIWMMLKWVCWRGMRLRRSRTLPLLMTWAWVLPWIQWARGASCSATLKHWQVPKPSEPWSRHTTHGVPSVFLQYHCNVSASSVTWLTVCQRLCLKVVLFLMCLLLLPIILMSVSIMWGGDSSTAYDIKNSPG